jgi:hypothetical protein
MVRSRVKDKVLERPFCSDDKGPYRFTRQITKKVTGEVVQVKIQDMHVEVDDALDSFTIFLAEIV